MADSLSLQNFLPYRCNNLAQQISTSLSRIYVDRFGISIAEWRILVTLAEYGELQSKAIAGHTGMDKVRVSRAVALLEGKGMLTRRPCDRDSRAALLALNGEGRDMYQRIVPQALAWEQALLQPLSAEEQAKLFEMIERLEGRLAELTE